MATLMRFDLSTESLIFEAPATYPANRPVELFQVQDRTASGKMQVEDLGVNIQRRVLNFVDMSKNDYEGLLNWYINVANGGMNSFTFTDERGMVGEVIILDPDMDFPETYFELFSGTMTLEYV